MRPRVVFVSTADAPRAPLSNEMKQLRRRFGSEIRRRRESLNLSLAQLALRVGLTSNFIATIENGMRNPSISTVLSLARGLEAPPAELITDAYGLGPAGLEVARLFNALKPKVQGLFISLVRIVCIRRRKQPALEAAQVTAAREAGAGGLFEPPTLNTPRSARRGRTPSPPGPRRRKQ